MCKILSARLLPSVNLDGPLSFLVEVHPEGESPLYIMSYYRGSYVFARDPLHARRYSYRTAKAHMANLLQRGDSKPVKNAVYFDREPIDTTVTFGYNKDNKTEEDPAMKTISAADLEKFHLTMDSFGDCCPNNWQEIAAFLNAKIDERIMAAHLTPEELEEEGHNIANDVWDDFGAGLFDGECPAPIDEGELSLDNGRTFMTRDDIEAEGLDSILAAHPAIAWSVIVNAMDDDTREAVSAELAPCSEEEFLLRYLELAPANLIIG